MDYEKKYNEAIERARTIIEGKDGWNFADHIEIDPVIKEIFPELAESEDERMRKAVMASVCNDSHISDEEKNRRLAWLERWPIDAGTFHVRYVEVQHPWGEEDEKNIGSIAARLDSILDCSNATEAIKITKEIAWLKSLRPQKHWKPSKEQMEALEHALAACESEWAYEDLELRSLIVDLKKQM